MKVVNLCVSLLVLSFIVACQPKTTSSDQLADEVYQVDSLLFLQDSLIGDTVELEGFCIDVCGHGGSHITLMGSEYDSDCQCRGRVSDRFVQQRPEK